MTPLALLLLARGEGASYGAAGLLTAGYGLALALGAPIAGRLVDQRGPRRILLERAVAYPALLALVAVLAVANAPVVAIGLAAAAAGALMPPVAPTVRTVLPRLAPDDLRSSAYSVEASLQELYFVGGPLLAAGLAVLDPVLGVLGSAAACAVGTLGVARLPPVREAGAVAVAGHPGGLLGPLASSGVRTIVAYATLLGLGFGTVELAMPAFAELYGSRELGGVALATFSAGSFVGGIVAGLYPTRDLRRRMLAFGALLALGLGLFVLAWSIPSLCVLGFVAGLPIAPGIAALYGLIDVVAPRFAVAEAFAWFGTSIGLGISLGAALGGALVDAAGPRAAFVVGPLVVASGTIVVALLRRTLRPAVPAAP